jgi:hypothetical protein
MVATATILKSVSVYYLTNAWSDFFLAYWGWLEEGSFQWPAPLLFQGGCILHLVSLDYLMNPLGRLVQFFCGFIGGWLEECSFQCQWGWVEDGSFRCPVPLLIQDGRCGSHLGFGSHQLFDERLGLLVNIFVAYWGWLEVGSCRWSALPRIQDGSHLGFGFC